MKKKLAMLLTAAMLVGSLAHAAMTMVLLQPAVPVQLTAPRPMQQQPKLVPKANSLPFRSVPIPRPLIPH